MKTTEADIPVEITDDLRITADRAVSLTPAEALRFAEEITLRAMMRRAALMPSRRAKRLRASRVGAAL